MHSEISSTLENYLEAILNLIAEKKVARSKDIANRLGVKRPTVTAALHSLADKGFIIYEPRALVTLTEKGRNIARCIDKRHHILKIFFTENLKLPEAEAEDAACKMEHGMSAEVCKKFAGILKATANDEDFNQEFKKRIMHESHNIHCDQSCCVSLDAESDPNLFQLNLIKPGKSVRIVRILKGPLKKRFSEMGITAGQEVTVLKVAPFGDPMEIRIRQFHLSLRRKEASNIIVEYIPETEERASFK